MLWKVGGDGYLNLLGGWGIYVHIFVCWVMGWDGVRGSWGKYLDLDFYFLIWKREEGWKGDKRERGRSRRKGRNTPCSILT